MKASLGLNVSRLDACYPHDSSAGNEEASTTNGQGRIDFLSPLARKKHAFACGGNLPISRRRFVQRM